MEWMIAIVHVAIGRLHDREGRNNTRGVCSFLGIVLMTVRREAAHGEFVFFLEPSDFSRSKGTDWATKK